MRKTILFIMLLLPIIGLATKALDAKSANLAIANVLSNFQSDTTKVGGEFEVLETLNESVTQLKLKMWLWVKGSDNLLDVKVDAIEYNNVKDQQPYLNASGSAELDLVKALGRETVNIWATDLDQIALEFAQDMSSEYGDAVKAEASISDRIDDADGNVVSLTLNLSVKFDLQKLPADKLERDVPFKTANITLSFSVTGISAKLESYLNPTYKGFESDEKGMYETLEDLVNNNAQEVSEFQSDIRVLIGIAQNLVDGNYRGE